MAILVNTSRSCVSFVFVSHGSSCVQSLLPCPCIGGHTSTGRLCSRARDLCVWHARTLAHSFYTMTTHHQSYLYGKGLSNGCESPSSQTRHCGGQPMHAARFLNERSHHPTPPTPHPMHAVASTSCATCNECEHHPHPTHPSPHAWRSINFMRHVQRTLTSHHPTQPLPQKKLHFVSSVFGPMAKTSMQIWRKLTIPCGTGMSRTRKSRPWMRLRN